MNEQAPDAKTKKEMGNVLMEWHFPEFEEHERGPVWYAVAGVLTVGLLIYAITDANFLFAMIILLFAFILFTHHQNDPLDVPFRIYERGIQMGELFYLYRELEHFCVIYDPPTVKRLYISPRAMQVRKELSIPLLEQDPMHVRSLLVDNVFEDLEREEESNTDAIARIFKI